MRRTIITGALALIGAAGGCDEALFEGGSSSVSPMFATITARDLRGLKGDERLEIDLSGGWATVFEFDFAAKPIDFSRIELIAPDAEPIVMSVWLARQAARRGVDLEGLAGRRFRLANDRMAGTAGLDAADPEAPEFRACEAVEVVALDAVVAVLFTGEPC